MTQELLEVLSRICGWIYTLSWSLSFYPQPLLNWRRKATSGISVDFPFLNVLGFLAYLVSNAAFLYSPVIREQYAARHHGLTPTVQFNDLAFAAHAFVLCVITVSQFVPSIWGFDKGGKKGHGSRVSKSALGIFVGSILGVCIVIIVVAATPSPDRKGWAWIDVASILKPDVYAISYVKLIITVIKYMPQVLTNWRNQSTVGWSIEQLMFDFAGGILSNVQLCIDSYLQHDWSGITGNPVKLGLANVSIFFDVIFFVQHWCLYNRAERKAPGTDEEEAQDDEESPLIT
ncbi:MAG: hypothetical protein M1818_006846 [Claussenomyces sp. TS43310]|nr:MAG: hypothetical protein M1818_006846 [Claussenomyces sp. TS43310]